MNEAVVSPHLCKVLYRTPSAGVGGGGDGGGRVVLLVLLELLVLAVQVK